MQYQLFVEATITKITENVSMDWFLKSLVGQT